MKIQRDGGKVTFITDARIDTYKTPQFAAEMEKALQDAQELTLDFSDLTYISSSGLRVVLLAVKTLAPQGTVRIVNVIENVYDVLEATGFTGICDVEMKKA